MAIVLPLLWLSVAACATLCADTADGPCSHLQHPLRSAMSLFSQPHCAENGVVSLARGVAGFELAQAADALQIVPQAAGNMTRGYSTSSRTALVKALDSHIGKALSHQLVDGARGMDRRRRSDRGMDRCVLEAHMVPVRCHPPR
ncbi:hypothetical protein [Rudaea sp.]|uniref:hypothetical protein n=1 Tax=Rudaea sp. TaxID=2136325 RepID=UPI003220890C